ncbi:MAG TPA: MBG domain-containing protein, partial [Gemmataceae bacterium]|nr:MBG domain-containing protein [Gemmataceae bacterium]
AYTITASQGTLSAANYTFTLKDGTLSITPATLTVTANSAAKVYGTGLPTFTDTITGFVNGDPASVVSGSARLTTTATTSSPPGSYPIIAAQGTLEATNYSLMFVNGTLSVGKYAFTYTIPNDSQTYGSLANFTTDLGTTIATGVNSEKLDISYSSLGDTATALVGTYSITGLLSNATGLISNYNVTLQPGTLTVTTVPGSIYVLDPTAGGALSLSGNASINTTGNIVVDSKSTSAISASGNAQVTAASVQVVGGVSKSGNAKVARTGNPGATGDPLTNLSPPTSSSSVMSVKLSGNASETINPGIYSLITVSGNASLTLNPGVYVVAGGGFTVSGNGNVSGSGVMIYNTASSYSAITGADGTGGTFGSVTLSGNGTFSLTPISTGTYAGILIFEDRSNPQALTLSGNSMVGISGTIYAHSDLLNLSGNGQLGSGQHPISLVVDTLTLSSNAVANTLAAPPAGTIAYSPAQIRAAYGISNLSLDGTGQTIAIVDAYADPQIYQALDAFDNQFGLTASGPTLYQQYGAAGSFLNVLNQNGQATSLPATDPVGSGTDNWEVEEALDVEWIHAIAPGARIILVEANSQSLSDLMAGVATAAGQPGVSVVSMSWGFPEGQAVFQSDEATYDSYFTTPGVTFVASTGDYGTADPEYPAFSPNVLAVGGTSLNLNADNSYNSQSGWGSYDSGVGAFIASGGGLSQYESEPAYQLGVQSTGSRSTPDVSFVADPNTGAWIADPYNLDPSNPFEVVGGTSLSAPAWAGLIALVDQGRAGAGELPLNSPSPTDAQQALYSLPQADYHVISSGYNGYTAGPGYNLVTGLGSPAGNLLVPDLIAWTGTANYTGPTVGPLQSAYLVNTGGAANGPTNAINVFSALTAPSLQPADSVLAAERTTLVGTLSGHVSGPSSMAAAPPVSLSVGSAAPTSFQAEPASVFTVAAWSMPSHQGSSPQVAALPVVSWNVGTGSLTGSVPPAPTASDGFSSDILDRLFQDRALLPEDEALQPLLDPMAAPSSAIDPDWFCAYTPDQAAVLLGESSSDVRSQFLRTAK